MIRNNQGTAKCGDSTRKTARLRALVREANDHTQNGADRTCVTPPLPGYRRCPTIGVLAIVIAISSCDSAIGQFTEWNNATGTPAPRLQAAENWNENLVPTASSDLNFAIGGSSEYEVHWDANTQSIVPTVRSIAVTGGDEVTLLNTATSTPLRQLNLSEGGASLNVNDGILTLQRINLVAAGSANIASGSSLGVGGFGSPGALSASQINVQGQFLAFDGSIINGRGVLSSTATVRGAGTTWNAAIIGVADGSTGRLRIQSGGRVVTDMLSGGNGTLEAPVNFSLLVNEAGSELVVNSSISMGFNSLLNEADLTVANGGVIRSGQVTIGESAEALISFGGQWISTGQFNASSTRLLSSGYLESVGASVEGQVIANVDSEWSNDGDLDIGRLTGANLLVERESVVTSTGAATMHQTSGGSGSIVTVADRSEWRTDGLLTAEAGSIHVSDDSDLFTGAASIIGPTGITISDNSRWTNDQSLNMTAGTITVSGSSLLETDSSGIISASVTVEGGSRWDNAGAATVTDSIVTVTGFGSRLENAGALDVSSFDEAASVRIESGAFIESVGGSIRSSAFNEFAVGSVTVSGGGSEWLNSGDLTVDGGVLRVENSGRVTTGDVIMSSLLGFDGVTVFEQDGRAVVEGGNASWDVEGDLTFTGRYLPNVSINEGGTVTVTGTTSLGRDVADSSVGGSVFLNGGTFNFGRTTVGDFVNFNANSGTLRGSLINTEVIDVATVGAIGDFVGSPFGPAVTVEIADALENSGTLYGSGRMDFSVNNLVDGQIELFTSDQMRFSGNGQNAGEINNFGGLVRFEGSLTNEAGGFIGGRGVFIANGGIENSGVMAFTGTTDVLGDIQMNAGSQMVTSGFATTTLFDDVVFNDSPGNRAEIRTSEGSATVILGGISGDMNFTGTGDVFAEGDLRPGNSPGIGSFEGDFFLGDTAATFIELGGVDLGTFDQFDIAGDFGIGGSLGVSLIDGFSLGFGQEFLIADVEGSMAGTFDGFGEGSLVGNYGGQDLFITYNGFGGNAGVGLFTAVPEPSSATLLVFCGIAATLRRRRVLPTVEATS